ncbi:response regulator [Verrucomicrobiota bacterium]
MQSALNRILLVDDDPDIQVILRVALENVGEYTLEVCSSGQEALERAPALKPDLILLDVMMPGMDGSDTLKALRKTPELEKTPVIFLTAKVQQQEIARYKKMGAIDVVTKPFDPMTLADDVKDIWSRYHARI